MEDGRRPTLDQQLGLEVGGQVGAFVSAAFSMSGKVESYTESLERDENVMVTVTDADGAVVFRSQGWVKGVTLETVPDKGGVPRHTLRKHSIKLGEDAPE